MPSSSLHSSFFSVSSACKLKFFLFFFLLLCFLSSFSVCEDENFLLTEVCNKFLDLDLNGVAEEEKNVLKLLHQVACLKKQQARRQSTDLEISEQGEVKDPESLFRFLLDPNHQLLARIVPLVKILRVVNDCPICGRNWATLSNFSELTTLVISSQSIPIPLDSILQNKTKLVELSFFNVSLILEPLKNNNDTTATTNTTTITPTPTTPNATDKLSSNDKASNRSLYNFTGIPLALIDTFSLYPSLPPLPALQILNLTSSGLSYYPLTSMYLPELRTLDLSYNNLKSFLISPRLVPSLRSLNISTNQLIDFQITSPLESLLHLNLNSNQLPNLLVNWTLSEVIQFDSSSSDVFLFAQSLTILKLSNNLLESFPSGITSLKSLQQLQVSSNQIFNLTIAFPNSLQELDVSANRIQTIEDQTMTSLISLKTLIIDYNYIITLPSSISFLTNLTTLSAFSCKLGALPSEINELSMLKVLQVGANRLVNISNTISTLVALEILNLTQNTIVSLPGDMGSLKGLQVLDLSYNYLTGLPESIGNLTSLQVLLINNNFITELPDTFGGLKSLATLTANRNLLKNITSSFGKLNNLVDVDLSNNMIIALPDTFLPNNVIRSFNIANNFLENIPYSFGNLTSINSLNIVNNSVPSLPPSIGSFTSLKIFLASSNQISYLPPTFNFLSSLETISLSSNFLTSVDEFGDFPQLKSLDLTRNQIVTLPARQNSMTRLEAIYLHANKLIGFPRLFRSLNNLRVLDLSSNRITKIEASDLSGLSMLVEIDLSKNNISSLELPSQPLPYLANIDISRNPLFLTLSAFVDQYSPFFSKIRSLSLSSCNLTGNLPIDLPPVQSLFLSDNQLNGSFNLLSILLGRNNNQLKMLDLSKNQMIGNISNVFPSSYQPSLDSLTSVLLNKNRFTGVLGSTFLITEPNITISLSNNEFKCLYLPTWCAPAEFFGTGDCGPCVSECSDGLLSGGEECDDGNKENGDGCNSLCFIEEGWECHRPNSINSSLVISPNPSQCIQLPQTQSISESSIILASTLPPAFIALVLFIIGMVLFITYRRRRNLISDLKKRLNKNTTNFLISESELELREKIGEGNFGQVFVGVLRKSTLVAVKVIKEAEGEDPLSSLITEAKVMSSIPPHPNIVQFLGICVTDSKKGLYIITQYIVNKSLQRYLFSQDDIPHPLQLLDTILGIASGMDHLSKYGVIHNDLSARNILAEEIVIRMSNNEVRNKLIPKVSDFGLATKIQRKKRDNAFPVRWTAPEVINDYRAISFKSDVWSFAILAYEVFTLCKIVPYFGIKNSLVSEKVFDGYKLPKPENCPNKVYELMLRCWNMNPDDRPSFEQICMEMADIVKEMRKGEDTSFQPNNALYLYLPHASTSQHKSNSTSPCPTNVSLTTTQPSNSYQSDFPQDTQMGSISYQNRHSAERRDGSIIMSLSDPSLTQQNQAYQNRPTTINNNQRKISTTPSSKINQPNQINNSQIRHTHSNPLINGEVNINQNPPPNFSNEQLNATSSDVPAALVYMTNGPEEIDQENLAQKEYMKFSKWKRERSILNLSTKLKNKKGQKKGSSAGKTTADRDSDEIKEGVKTDQQNGIELTDSKRVDTNIEKVNQASDGIERMETVYANRAPKSSLVGNGHQEVISDAEGKQRDDQKSFMREGTSSSS